MNRGLRPVLDSIDFHGCPNCGEHPVEIQVDGPNYIRLSCGHVVRAEAWADEQYRNNQIGSLRTYKSSLS